FAIVAARRPRYVWLADMTRIMHPRYHSPHGFPESEHRGRDRRRDHDRIGSRADAANDLAGADDDREVAVSAGTRTRRVVQGLQRLPRTGERSRSTQDARGMVED